MRAPLHHNIQTALLMAVAATLPFPLAINHTCLIAALAYAVLTGHFRHSIRQMAMNPLAGISLLLFLLYMVSVAISSNTQEAWLIVERRLSLVIFPVLMLSGISPRTKQYTLLAFVAGNGLALLYCLLHAGVLYQSESDTSVFFYHQLSSPLKLNAVYFAAYLVFSLHILFEEWKRPENRFRYLYAPVALLLLTGCILLNSKMMLVILVLGVALRLGFQSDFSRRARIAGLSLVVLLPVLLVLLFPPLKARFITEFKTNTQVINQQHYTYDTPFTGTSLRVMIWRYCLEILTEKNAWIMGVGTGDFQDELNKRYRETGVYTGNPELGDTGYLGYGPHNQYIETVFALGVAGLLVFCALIYRVWKEALRQRSMLFIQLALLLSMFCLSESALSTNKGILFFLFFIFLFQASPIKHTDE